MASNAENLATAYANYTAILADISLNPKPSYTVGDRTFSWTEYQKFLTEQLQRIENLQQTASGPFIVRAYGRA